MTPAQRFYFHGALAQPAADITAVAATTGLTAAQAAPVVSSLLTAAGMSTAAGPVGWVVAGGIGLAAGTIVAVRAIRAGKVRKEEVKAIFANAGNLDAATAPAYAIKAMKWSAMKRAEEAVGLQAKLRKQTPGGKLATKTAAKLSILGTVDLLEMAQLRGEEPPPAIPVATMESQYGGFDLATWGPALGGGVLLLLAALLIALGGGRR